MYLGRVFVAFTGFFVFTLFFYLHRDRDYFRSIFYAWFRIFFYIASQIYERPKGSNKNLCFSRKPNLIGSDLKKCTQRVISPIFSLSQMLIIFFRTSSEQFSKQNTVVFSSDNFEPKRAKKGQSRFNLEGRKVKFLKKVISESLKWVKNSNVQYLVNRDHPIIIFQIFHSEMSKFWISPWQ